MSTQQNQNKLAKYISPERLKHSLAVERDALELARRWGADCEKATLAGLFHDIAKGMTGPAMLERARTAGLPVSALEAENPKLLHGKIGALITEDELGITDPEILSAIRKHTFGSENMSLLEKIIYLADHLEPGRIYPGVAKARAIAFKDLDQAIVATAEATLAFLKNKGASIDPQTIKTRDWYRNKL